MDEIQLMTQPEKEHQSSSPEETLQKLKDLVADSLPGVEQRNEKDNEDKEDANSKKKDALNQHQKLQNKKDQSPKKEKGLGDIDSEKKQSEENVEYDHDGFQIPAGKIPLDGHFSTNEIKELVELSKAEGILKEDVHLEVLESNEMIGDKVVLTESNRKKDNNSEEDKDNKDDVNLSEGELKDNNEEPKEPKATDKEGNTNKTNVKQDDKRESIDPKAIWKVANAEVS